MSVFKWGKEKGDKLDGEDRVASTWSSGGAQGGYFHRGILGPCYSKRGTGASSISLTGEHRGPPGTLGMESCILTGPRSFVCTLTFGKCCP